MGFYRPTENPCVMMRENLKTKCCEYIAVYQDDLYIVSPTPEAILNTLENKYELNINPDLSLGTKYPNDPGGTMICQLRKYLEKSYVNVTTLFNDNPPQDLRKNTKMTYQGKEQKWVQPLTLLQEESNRMLSIVISIVSCSPLSSCYKLKILLQSCLTCF